MNLPRMAATVSSIAVAIIVVVGLFLSGPPSGQRMVRLDDQRVMDLRTLAGSIDKYRDDHDFLPVELLNLVDGRRLTRLPKDPETGVDYEYVVTGDAAYRLCATFSTRSPDDEEDDFWSHEAGRQCFSFDLEDAPGQ